MAQYSISLEDPKLVPYEWHYGEIDPEILKKECLHHLFEDSADRFPNNLAVVYDKTNIKYSELESRCNRLARYLRDSGVVTGDRVGIFIKPSIDMYVSILAIMKAGAAYVPIDTGAPQDRVMYISEDCKLKKLVTTSALCKDYPDTKNMVFLDEIQDVLQNYSDERYRHEEINVKNTDLCYLIYTSGTTGRPKGVQLEHRNACHLARAEQKIYNIVPEDRIYQGFTIAFDASVEELWMAFFNGATLIAATEAMKHAGMDLSKLLTDAGVTVLSTVSTLLSILNDDIPTVRLLIQGGECINEQIIKKWSKPGRRLFNTYGPTESTVIATYSECCPGKPITIGRPISNYSVYIVDDKLKEVPPGEAGELCIGGIGLARGYLHRDDLTREKFIRNPFFENKHDSPILYRTGDLVKFNEDGDIEFHGRIDTQVKIRGYRVELSEIESVIGLSPDVQASVVSVYDIDGVQSLVAYILPRDSAKGIDSEAIYELLHEKLPSYMMPTYYEVIETVPKLISGKTDRKCLPAPTGKKFKVNKNIILPRNDIEEDILNVWQDVFKSQDISVTDQFFDDLGGHSLRAALATSRLRENPNMNSLSVSDIYKYQTIEKLAEVVKERMKNTEASPASKEAKKVREFPWLSHKICGLFQAASMYLVYLIGSIPFLAIFLYVFYGNDFLKALLSVNILILYVAVLLLYLPVSMTLSVLMKWIMIGRYKEGDYPVWGLYYFRVWFAGLFQSLVPVPLLTGSPLISIYLRLMGTKVGKNCYIGSLRLGVFDLISIGDNCSLGFDSEVLGSVVEDGYLKLRRIEIGNNCYVGPNSILSNSSKMMDNSQLGEQSMLRENETIPSNERWTGSPARKSDKHDANLDAMFKSGAESSLLRRFCFGVSCYFADIILQMIQLAATLPGLFLMIFGFLHMGMWVMATIPVIALSYNFFMCIEIALIKKLLIGEIKPGHYDLYTVFYFRKWFVDKLMAMSLSSMHCFYATLYTPHFLRLLGCKIGKNVEVSTVTHITPDLLTIGEGSFIADSSLLGTPKIYMGQIYISNTEIGKKTFIGNSALIPSGTRIGDNSLIGVLSIPPDIKTVSDDTSWLGSPAIFLPKRDINKDFDEEQTFKPTRALIAKRYSIEFVKILLPGTISSAMMVAIYFVLVKLASILSLMQLLLVFPLISFAAGMLVLLFVVLLKKLLIGTYRPRVEPLWSTFVWRSELVTGVYESLAVPVLSQFLGTPFIRYFLGLFGVKIAKHVYMGTTDITEFDLVEIEEGCYLNRSTLQTHLFEDRVMKMSKIKIKKNCNIGLGAFILYDTVMNEHSSIGNHSLLMKGESLLQDTEWEGIPVERKL
jgi:non-ribosomal peptide synthetase-like protein